MSDEQAWERWVELCDELQEALARLADTEAERDAAYARGVEDGIELVRKYADAYGQRESVEAVAEEAFAALRAEQSEAKEQTDGA